MHAYQHVHVSYALLGELDSYMYQTAGHEMIEAVAEALSLPLHRRALQGTSLNVAENYAGPKAGDEVEDLYELLREVKVSFFFTRPDCFLFFSFFYNTVFCKINFFTRLNFCVFFLQVARPNFFYKTNFFYETVFFTRQSYFIIRSCSLAFDLT